jgi:DNA-binding response OmpR family regulator
LNDSKALAEIFESWVVEQVQTCAEALAVLRHSRCAAVLCEKDLPDGDWRDFLTRVAQLGQGPPVIVMSRAADESLWVDVLANGGFDVVAKPLDPTEVRRVMRCASDNRRPLHAVARAC